MNTKSSCGSCGKPTSESEAFCGSCGTSLGHPAQLETAIRDTTQPGPDVKRCTSCNAPLYGEVQFCTGCGAPRSQTGSGTQTGLDAAQLERLQEATQGDFQILGQIGRGGMGSVFLALDKSLHRHVAIKVLAPSLLQDASLQERFRIEAKTVAALRHPGIVNIHRFRTVSDLFYFVMDYVEGAPLGAMIRSQGALPIELVRSILYDVGGALHYAHTTGDGIIHRDIKPGNIVLDSGGHGIVMDFGISKATNTQAGLTMTGMIVGTPEYMSPEQCRGGGLTTSSDQYSLGLVAYALLTGAPPFAGQYWNVLGRQTSEVPKSVAELRPDCPPELSDGIDRMLAKAVRDRFPDVRTAIKALGATPQEDGGPVRVALGELVAKVSGATGPSVPVASLGIVGLPDRASPGETLNLTVTPMDGLGRPLANREYTLETTNPGVLEVVSQLEVRAVQEGSAMVVARCEGAEISLPLLVAPRHVAKVAIDQLNEPVHPGTEVTLHAVTLDESDEPLVGRTVHWTSSAPAVAEVTPEGVLRGVGVGATAIFASSEGRSASIAIRVSPSSQAVQSVAPPATVQPGTPPPTVLSGTPPPSMPSAAPPAAEQPSPPVTEQPPAHPATVESFAHPAQPSGGAMAARPSAPGPPRRKKGKWGIPVGAAVVIAIAATGYWYLPRAEQPSATGDEVSPPTATALATLATLGITAGGESIADLELLAGEELELDASALDSEGQPVEAAIAWTSSDQTIATVDEQGRLLAIATGTATITASSAGISESIPARITAPVVVEAPDPAATISQPPAPEPTQAPPAVSLLSVSRDDSGEAVGVGLEVDMGAVVPIRAEALSASGSEVAGAAISWTSSAPAVASIDPQGVLRALTEGTAIISARAQGVTHQFAVDVAVPPPGTLLVTVRPWAYVSIDGVQEGEDQTRLQLDLPAGTHTIRLENPALSSFDTTVVVRPNETTTVDKLLTSGGG